MTTSEYTKFENRILHFTADWCGPCKSISGQVEKSVINTMWNALKSMLTWMKT